MKVLHLSTSDREGGAAIAAYRLSEAMRMEGEEAMMLVLVNLSDSPQVVSIDVFKNKLYRYYIPLKIVVYNVLRKVTVKPKMTFSCGISKTWGVVGNSMLKEADVIYIHWVQLGFLSVADISKIIAIGKPVFIICHDMGHLTGGCNHSFGCSGWKHDCRECPFIGRRVLKRMAHHTLIKKINNWRKGNVSIVTPSKWLSDCAMKSSLFSEARIYTIPNTINTSVFQVLDKLVCREMLGLPVERKLILFGAIAGSSNPYKGWNYANKVMERLKNEADLVVFGNVVNTRCPYKIHSIGKLTDEASLSLLYNAVDVYISPTLAEAFGQTLVESISCGTKTVAFNVGGVPDIINHLSNGYLAEPNNLDDLECGIRWALESSDEKERIRLHESIVSRFSYAKVVKMHKRAISEVLMGGVIS